VFAKRNLEIDLELWWAGKFYLRNEKLTELLNKLRSSIKKGVITEKVISQILKLMGYEDNEENRKVVYEWVRKRRLGVV